MTDHIDAIAIAIESLGFNIGHAYGRRAKASFVVHALRLAGYKITRDNPDPPADRGEIERLRKAVEVARTALLTIERRSEEMRAAITHATTGERRDG